MAFKVSQGKRGEGKSFVSKEAWLQWCNSEIKHERAPTERQYVHYDGATFIQRKMLGKTRTVIKSKRYNRFDLN